MPRNRLLSRKQKTPKISDVLGSINTIAPFRLAEDWDNVGLQLGHPSGEAKNILVALEISDNVIAEAKTLGSTLIVTHHPLIFRPLKHLNESHTIPGYVVRLVRDEIALIAAHTNVDSVENGTNGEIADRLRLDNRRFLLPSFDIDRNVKYVVFVPTSHVEAVIAAADTAGAGVIGNYSHCTFRSPGTGTYQPLEGASPYAGEIGKLEQAEDEVRLEVVCPKSSLDALIRAVRNVHPYEEVAFDIYPLESTSEPRYGLGLIGDLPEPQSLDAFSQTCKHVFSLGSVGVIGDLDRPVRRVAICSGAGGEAVQRWRNGTADVLVTGELRHNECTDVRDRRFGAVLLGHFESEAIVCERFARQISEELKSRGFKVNIVASKAERSPVLRR